MSMRRSLLTLVGAPALAIALAACGSSPGPADRGDAGAPPRGDDAAVVPPPVPYYEVPTSDPALAPHAFFGVPDVHYVTTGSTVVLTYDFPPELSGVVDQPIELSGPIAADGSSTISGPAGTGTCTAPSAGIVRCTETFGAGLALDRDAALAQAAAVPDPVVRAGRAAVIEAFIQDPIGIVVFDLEAASEPSGGDRDRGDEDEPGR